MRKVLIILSLIILCSQAFAVERPSTKHDVYFKGTDYELNVYRIYGRQDGKTMFILGGIQGDEPGGFLSADLFSDLRLEKGNLIIIPRANFKSVILYDRGPDGDMNRRFLKNPDENAMNKVVDVIKKLMGEADVFLNLHDGWGFHYPTYVDKWHNPKKFGQSVITDANVYKCESGRQLDLRSVAEKVVEATNKKIGDEKYFMHYFDTHTKDKDTNFKDMRKTATYWAVRNYCIPAYGIETSKNLPSTEMKIRHHNYAVSEFMKIYGIVPESPTIFLEKPKMSYAIISVNGEPKIVENGSTIIVHKGDECEVTHIESNYERGLSCDFLGYGDLNDYRKKVKLKGDSVIVFRKDHKKMGYIDLRLNKANGNGHHYFVFVIKHNGKKELVLSGDTYQVSPGDTVQLVSAFSDNSCGMEYPINFKGYVPPDVRRNTGDDRGIVIPIQKKNFMTKYSKDNDNATYPVVVSYNGEKLGSFWFHIK